MKDQPTNSSPVGLPKFHGYDAYLAEREEILRLKWLKSERMGRDVGWEDALLEWVTMHRVAWLRLRDKETASP